MVTTTEAISSANDLLAAHTSLLSSVYETQERNQKRLSHLLGGSSNLDVYRPKHFTTPSSPSRPSTPPQTVAHQSRHIRQDLPPAKRARVARYHNYIPEEETIRNDYSQRYVDGGEWPQNWVLGAEPEHRFEEYPKQQRLLALKKAAVEAHSLPPCYLPYSELASLSTTKFDAILLDPPFSSSFTWDDLQQLPIPALAADPSFVFLWVGSGAGEGLERGREVLAKWGYRRCEDVVWVKTNHESNKGPGTDPPTTSLLTRTKQHCLIGIRGTVRRSTDSWFVHCNVDTDVIIWEGSPTDPTLKPPEMYSLIENFCLGMRRLEVFGRNPSSIRRGWLTLLREDQINKQPIEAHLWDKDLWEHSMREMLGNATGKLVVPMTQEIDTLRPKSPVRHNASNQSGGGGGMGGTSGGVQMGMVNGGPRFGGSMGGMVMPQPIMPIGMGMDSMLWPGVMANMGMANMQGMGNMGGMNLNMPMMNGGGFPVFNGGGMGINMPPNGNGEWEQRQNQNAGWNPQMMMGNFNGMGAGQWQGGGY